MTLRKEFNVLVVAFFMAFVELAVTCQADELCGFGDTCPHFRPPCYKVKFEGIMEGGIEDCNEGSQCPWCETHDFNDCDPNYCDFPLLPSLNKTWILRFDEYYYPTGSCVYRKLPLNKSPYVSISISDSNICVSTTDGDCGYRYEGPRQPTAYNVENDVNVCTGSGRFSLCGGGTASWEPIWDCNECNYPCTLNINVSDYENPLHYAREDCCPPGEEGDSTSPMFTCVDANFVVPVYKIWEYDPNASEKWKEVTSSTLVKVTPDPNQCAGKKQVSFLVQALKGKPPAKAKVKCTAAFFTATGQTGSKSVTIYIEPAKGDCCEDSSGCSSGKCEDGPPPPYGIPGPVLGTI